jgi:predicted metal-dependent hydrolase
MIIRIDHTTGEVVVTSPTKKAMKEALAYAAKEHRWIARHRARLPKRQPFVDQAIIPFQGVPTRLVHRPDKRRGVWHDEEAAQINISGDTEFVGRRTEDFLRRMAKAELSGCVQAFTAHLQLPMSRVTVRDTSSRWGSCSSTGALSFSWRLILAPPHVLRYVAAHECAHLMHHNHSKAFWALVQKLDENFSEGEAWLSQSGYELFRYGAK